MEWSALTSSFGSRVRELTRRHRGAARALAAMALGVALWYALWIAPLRREVGRLHELREAQTLQLRLRRKSLATLRRQLQRMEARARGGRSGEIRPLPGDDPSGVMAYLQELLRKAVEEGLLEVRGYQLLDSRPFEGYLRVQVRLELQADAKGLYRFLRSVERSPYALGISRLEVNARPGGRRPLRVRARLEALMKAGAT